PAFRPPFSESQIPPEKPPGIQARFRSGRGYPAGDLRCVQTSIGEQRQQLPPLPPVLAEHGLGFPGVGPVLPARGGCARGLRASAALSTSPPCIRQRLLSRVCNRQCNDRVGTGRSGRYEHPDAPEDRFIGVVKWIFRKTGWGGSTS